MIFKLLGLRWHSAAILGILVVFISILVSSPVAAYTDEALQGIIGNTYFYDPTLSFCGTPTATSTGSTAAPSQSQIANAQIIIGIAKTENLGQQAALIALMVGLDESGLRNLANSNVPVSLSIPHEGVGSDHDSVGIMQQRPSTGWSTIANGPAADSNQAAVAQLMTPAYAAEAFLGSPPGSNAPAALSKGLQNVANWQSLPPAVAAQKVQASGTPDGSNYAPFQSLAQSLLNQYWDPSPAVPLPVPLTGGSGGAGGSVSVVSCTSGAGKVDGDTQSLAQQILANPNILFPYTTANGDTRAVVEALARGEKAPVTCRDGSAGNITSTDINPNILKFILDLGQQGKVGVNALSDKCHLSGSNHYKGMAVDFECGSVPFDISRGDATAQKYGGHRNSETCSANFHWHYDFLMSV